MFEFLSLMRDSSRFSRWLISALFIVLCCLSLSEFSLAEDRSHLLDGKTFIGKNGEKGQKLAEYEDEKIIFQDGMFTSVSCEPYNFGSSPYTAEFVGEKIQFDAVTESPTHGKITWRGIITNDQAEVSFVWTKQRWYWDIRREYWFRGTLQ
jgi:hypothetical protein